MKHPVLDFSTRVKFGISYIKMLKNYPNITVRNSKMVLLSLHHRLACGLSSYKPVASELRLSYLHKVLGLCLRRRPGLFYFKADCKLSGY